MADQTPADQTSSAGTGSAIPIPEEAVLNFEVAYRYKERGPNPEYKDFERLLDVATFSSPWAYVQTDIWKFIEDAVEGKGGFVDGSYLVPFKREAKRRGGKLDDKFWERVASSDYDNFAKTICNAPWNYIVQNRDAVARESKDPDLEAFWNDVDGRGTNIIDFLEYPARQARMYGTGWIFIDREKFSENATAADSDANRPYLYCVPTRNVVDWVYDDDYELQALAILEKPDSDDDEAADDPEKCNLRVWTKSAFVLFTPNGKGWNVDLERSGPNDLGEIPAVQLFDEYPGPGRGLGDTIMPSVARLARTHYNLRSEAREIQRKCASFLAYPTKDLDGATKIQIGSDSALPYNADAGKPEWVSPDLAALEHYREEMKDTKDSAFQMSHMTAISGYLEKTSSGFHTQAIFDETNKAIGKFASSLETAESKTGRLFLRLKVGGPPPNEAGEKKIRDTFSVAYPREFGIRDLSAEIDTLEKRLSLELGQADAADAIYDFYQSAYPRKDRKELRQNAEKAAADLYKGMAQKNGANVVPMTPRDKAKAIAAKAAGFAPSLTGREALGLPG